MDFSAGRRVRSRAALDSLVDCQTRSLWLSGSLPLADRKLKEMLGEHSPHSSKTFVRLILAMFGMVCPVICRIL